jgi:hypothetical protein
VGAVKLARDQVRGEPRQSEASCALTYQSRGRAAECLQLVACHRGASPRTPG